MTYVMTVNDELIRRRIEFIRTQRNMELSALAVHRTHQRKEMEMNRKHLHWLRSHQMTQIDLCQDVKIHGKTTNVFFFSLLLNRLKCNVRISLPVLAITAGQLIHGTMATQLDGPSIVKTNMFLFKQAGNISRDKIELMTENTRHTH